MDVKFSVNLNITAVEERLKKAAVKAIFDTSKSALKDCNHYCKQDQAGLINSSLIHSELEPEMLPMDEKTAEMVAKSSGSDLNTGTLRWKTPYARRQYYLDAARKDKNPNARKMWAHYAASAHGNEWLLRMQKAFSQYAKR